LYIADDRVVKEVEDALQAEGVNVRQQQLRGALHLMMSRDAHLRGTRFESEAMLQFLNDAVERALDEGFTGLRAAGEMTWILAGAPGTEKAMEYEALMNEFYPGSHAIGMCLYHRSRMPASILHGSLHTHPCVCTDSRIHDNPYYQPPDVFFGRASERAQFDLQLQRVTASAAKKNGRRTAPRARRRR
jgi:hypothetical protein